MSRMESDRANRRCGEVRGAVAVMGVILGTFSLAARESADEVDYTPVVTLRGVKVLEASRERTGKKPRKAKSPPLEFLFDVDENVPAGAKIQFTLEYRLQQLAQFHYEFKGGRRTGIKYVWTPELRLPFDTYPYILGSSMPLASQTPSVRKAIERKKKEYPPRSEPWPWNHKKEEFVLGTEEDIKAEEKEVAEIYKGWALRLLKLNNEFVTACEEVDAKKKFFEDDKLDKDAFKAFVSDWLKRAASLQAEIVRFRETEPGLWAKNLQAWSQTQNLSRMVAKRCFTRKLRETLSRSGVTASEFRVAVPKGFDYRTRSLSSPQAMKATFENIARLAKFAEEEKPKPPEGTEPDSEAPEKDDETKEGTAKKGTAKKDGG